MPRFENDPEPLALAMACSGLTLERDPLPDPTSWRSIEDRGERLRIGLAALYGWYERNAELIEATKPRADLIIKVIPED